MTVKIRKLLPSTMNLLPADIVERGIVIYGAGMLGRVYADFFRKHSITPLMVTDTNPEKWGTEIMGVPVLSPENACDIYGANSLFVVAIEDYAYLEEEMFAKTYLCRKLQQAGCVDIGYIFAEGNALIPGSATYGDAFYQSMACTNSTRKLLPAAREILSLFPDIQSVVDVGCGLGTWLAAIKEIGGSQIREIRGIDGGWIPPDLLQIDHGEFDVCDFFLHFPKQTKIYDLALCLEVAEHIPECNAVSFIEFLTSLSDRIVFSAAIPGQGGEHHVNEQWPDYWEKHFQRFGYRLLDALRRAIWSEGEIEPCYRQNMLIAVKEGTALPKNVTGDERPLSLAHPEIFAFQQRKLIHLRTRAL